MEILIEAKNVYADLETMCPENWGTCDCNDATCTGRDQ